MEVETPPSISGALNPTSLKEIIHACRAAKTNREQFAYIRKMIAMVNTELRTIQTNMQPLAFTAPNEKSKTMLSSVATVRPHDDEEQVWKDCMKMKRKMVKAMLAKNCHINALLPCKIRTEGRWKDTRKTFLGLFDLSFTAKDAERHPCVGKTREKFQALGAKTEPEVVQQYCLG